MAYNHRVGCQSFGRQADEEDVDDVLAVPTTGGRGSKDNLDVGAVESRRSLPTAAEVVDRDHVFAGKRSGFDSLTPPTHVVARTRPALPRFSLSATRAMLYDGLDVRGVRNGDVLRIFLVTRRDVTSLMHTLRIPAWAWAQTWAYLIPRRLARMDNRGSLTHPSFDLHILRHHTAF
ncbi:hypothetical protein EDD85DRAFT_958661 [Armillaria nabsnona]|nr:hypothetical protein EDD85DRAFT_958661 [Armillaria nabsnona]